MPLEDPPRSYYPAYAAFKAAELQSAEVAEAYLRRLREAAMIGRRNVARSETLQTIAEEVQQDGPMHFESERLAHDLDGPQALDAFREDLRLARYLGIRYPTLILRRPGEERGLLLTGYRPDVSLVSALRHVESKIHLIPRAAPHGDYVAHWGGTLERELNELDSPSS